MPRVIPQLQSILSNNLIKMSTELKSLFEFSGIKKILLAIVLVCSLPCIRLTYAKYTGRDQLHEKVKREVEELVGEGRLLGGKEAAKQEYRFIVVFQLPEQINTRSIQCHGVLVAPRLVLTTAHDRCKKLVKETTTALAGMHDLSKPEVTVQSREVCHVEIHPKVSGLYKNSYMLIYLSDPFWLNDYVGTISLPLKNTASPKECVYAGWGRSNVDKLTHKTLQIKDCKEGPSVICTSYGPCGDMGSPLVCGQGNREFVAGIYGHSNCAAGQPVYFSSFLDSAFLDWYKEKAKQTPKACYSTHG